jgi:hypothetical protein
LRPATLAAVPAAGPDGLSEDEFGRRLQAALGFTAANRERRQEWMSDPAIKGVGQVEAERTLARVLAHRAWVDRRRGWRFTNPNLEELGLVRADYVSLDELAADDSAFANAQPYPKGDTSMGGEATPARLEVSGAAGAGRMMHEVRPAWAKRAGPQLGSAWPVASRLCVGCHCGADAFTHL